MNTAMISMESAYLSSEQPKNVTFKVEPGAPGYILYSIITGRNRIGKTSSLEFRVLDWNQDYNKKDLLLIMNKNCIVYKKN